MNDTRHVPCSHCDKHLVYVHDYMEGDEGEALCDRCNDILSNAMKDAADAAKIERERTGRESIEILALIAAQNPESFVRRIWDSLGFEGHEAIRREFKEIEWKTCACEQNPKGDEE